MYSKISYNDAKKIVRKYKFKYITEYLKIWKEEFKPLDISPNPQIAFKNKGWKGWLDFIGKTYESLKVDWLKFKVARSLVRKLKIKNGSQYKNLKDKKKYRLPQNPDRVYKNKGWLGMDHFLGTEYVRILKDEKGKNHYVNYRPFYKARSYARNLRLKSRADWDRFIKSGKKPKEIPSSPQGAYKKKWKDWGDWLGTIILTTSEMYNRIDYNTAKKIVHKFKLKNQAQYKNIWKKKLKPLGISMNPSRAFKNKGWKGWKDFIGKKYMPLYVDWLKFEEAKKFISKLKLKSRHEYRNYKSKKKYGLPHKADRVYKKNWKGWKDFLGKSYDPYFQAKFNKAKHLKNALSYNQAKRYIKKYKFPSWAAYGRGWKKFNLEKKHIPKKANNYYKDKGWKNSKDFLGTG